MALLMDSVIFMKQKFKTEIFLLEMEPLLIRQMKIIMEQIFSHTELQMVQIHRL